MSLSVGYFPPNTTKDLFLRRYRNSISYNVGQYDLFILFLYFFNKGNSYDAHDFSLLVSINQVYGITMQRAQVALDKRKKTDNKEFWVIMSF